MCFFHISYFCESVLFMLMITKGIIHELGPYKYA